MLTLTIIITSIAQTILGLFVYLKRRDSLTNILFGLLSIATLAWALVSYASVSLRQPDAVLFTARLTLFFVVIQNTFFFLFAKTFPSQTWKHSKILLKLYICLAVIAAGATLSPFVFTAAMLKNGHVETSAGPAIIVFIVHAAISITFAFMALVKRMKTTQGAQKSQTQLLLLASILNWAIVPFTNFIITAVLSTSIFLILSPFYTLLFAGLIAYSIISQKLFDIRALVARSVAYVLILATLVIVYGGGLFGISSLVFRNNAGRNFLELGLNILLAVFLAVSFQSIKQAIDKLTNRIFFRDSYDTQSVLDKIGDTLVGNISTHKIQRAVIDVLEPAIRPTYMAFLMLNTSGRLHLKGLKGEDWQTKDSIALQRILGRLNKRVTISDDLDDETEKKVKAVLRSEDINAVAPLATKDQIIGYLVAGPKKSGDIYTRQDAGLLSIAADELGIALQNAQRFEEIEAFNLTLQEKVTEATRELKRTNKKLIALDEAKDEFISMASHQLRTPLTSIKGYLSMMVEGDLGKVNPAQEKALKEAFGSSQRMVYLIADFLNVSRIRTGKFMIETKEVDLPQIVTEELTQLRKMAASRDLTLTYAQPGEFPRVKLDDNKIRQVMMNMVDNAIYYTPTGGTITIQLYSTGREIIFKVVDDGIGVPKVEHHKLFTKFYRASNARKSRPDGTGLGLFMSQKIVVGQGGAIIFESVEGKGSTFGFRFPLDKIRI